MFDGILDLASIHLYDSARIGILYISRVFNILSSQSKFLLYK